MKLTNAEIEALESLDAMDDQTMSIKHGGGHGAPARLQVLRDTRTLIDVVRTLGARPRTPFGDSAA